MYFLILHTAPPKDEPEAGGAYVSCWVEATDPESAELAARRHIREEGRTPLEAPDQQTVTRADYLGSESLGYYESAVADGACYVMHIYPPE